jgi:hypothetical protein
MTTRSIMTCPKCGYRSAETMPIDACQFFYQCLGCGGRLKPLPGDCCVFCSYGTAPCPPKQVAPFAGALVPYRGKGTSSFKRPG